MAISHFEQQAGVGHSCPLGSSLNQIARTYEVDDDPENNNKGKTKIKFFSRISIKIKA